MLKYLVKKLSSFWAIGIFLNNKNTLKFVLVVVGIVYRDELTLCFLVTQSLLRTFFQTCSSCFRSRYFKAKQSLLSIALSLFAQPNSSPFHSINNDK